ncbi:MAG: queG 7 [Firmicutes bacterium]|nr:queG 7 [Bacillota bacterium]
MDLGDLTIAVEKFLRDNSLNVVNGLHNMPIFDIPLLGVAQANDPLFERLRADDAVGRLHKLPQDWLVGAKSVLSYFLPFSLEVRKANRPAGLPAIEWLYGRIEGESVNDALRNFLVQLFSEAGYTAVAPCLDERFSVVAGKSNWSERHVAFVAGLGTFSLNRSLITRRGSAGRIGSVVVDAEMTPTPRYYASLDENCSKCGVCVPRCPSQAISEGGKDNTVCGQYIEQMKVLYKPRYGCGKCQTAVPCEAGIPRK